MRSKKQEPIYFSAALLRRTYVTLAYLYGRKTPYDGVFKKSAPGRCSSHSKATERVWSFCTRWPSTISHPASIQYSYQEWEGQVVFQPAALEYALPDIAQASVPNFSATNGRVTADHSLQFSNRCCWWFRRFLFSREPEGSASFIIRLAWCDSHSSELDLEPRVWQ